MSRIASSFIATVIAAGAVLAAPLTASAQEAIMLETIGAVRMAAPEEVRRTTAQDAQTGDRQVVRAAAAETVSSQR